MFRYSRSVGVVSDLSLVQPTNAAARTPKPATRTISNATAATMRPTCAISMRRSYAPSSGDMNGAPTPAVKPG